MVYGGYSHEFAGLQALSEMGFGSNRRFSAFVAACLQNEEI